MEQRDASLRPNAFVFFLKITKEILFFVQISKTDKIQTKPQNTVFNVRRATFGSN